MNRTGIKYLDYTWNPLAMRCAPVSEGCAHCWHLRMCDRMAGKLALPKAERDAWAGKTPSVLREKELTAPLRRTKPARIGIQLMGDWMHDDVPEEWIDDILDVISACPQHTFLTLTKRPHNFERKLYGTKRVPCRELGSGDFLPNLWLGVSVENQRTADERIPILLQITAAVRWVSVEPLLEQVDLCLTPGVEISAESAHRGIHWVVAGAESGPDARPCKPEWVRSLKNQCADAGVPFWYKGGALDGREYHEWPEAKKP